MADDAGALLVRSGLVAASALEAARARVASAGGTLGEQLVLAGAISDEALTEFYSQRLLVPKVNPNTLARLVPRVIAAIPAELAIERRAIPVSLDRDNNLTVAMSDPSDRRAVDEIGFFTGAYVVRAVATQMQIAWCLAHYFGHVTSLGGRLIQPQPAPTTAGAADDRARAASSAMEGSAAPAGGVAAAARPAAAASGGDAPRAIVPAARSARAKGLTGKVNATRHRAIAPITGPIDLARPLSGELDRIALEARAALVADAAPAPSAPGPGAPERPPRASSPPPAAVDGAPAAPAAREASGEIRAPVRVRAASIRPLIPEPHPGEDDGGTDDAGASAAPPAFGPSGVERGVALGDDDDDEPVISVEQGMSGSGPRMVPLQRRAKSNPPELAARAGEVALGAREDRAILDDQPRIIIDDAALVAGELRGRTRASPAPRDTAAPDAAIEVGDTSAGVIIHAHASLPSEPVLLERRRSAPTPSVADRPEVPPGPATRPAGPATRVDVQIVELSGDEDPSDPRRWRAAHQAAEDRRGARDTGVEVIVIPEPDRPRPAPTERGIAAAPPARGPGPEPPAGGPDPAPPAAAVATGGDEGEEIVVLERRKAPTARTDRRTVLGLGVSPGARAQRDTEAAPPPRDADDAGAADAVPSELEDGPTAAEAAPAAAAPDPSAGVRQLAAPRDPARQSDDDAPTGVLGRAAPWPDAGEHEDEDALAAPPERAADRRAGAPDAVEDGDDDDAGEAHALGPIPAGGPRRTDYDPVDEGWGPPGTTIPPPLLGALPGSDGEEDGAGGSRSAIPVPDLSAAPLIVAPPSPPESARGSSGLPETAGPGLVRALEDSTSRAVELIRALERATDRDTVIALMIRHLAEAHIRSGFFAIRPGADARKAGELTVFRVEPSLAVTSFASLRLDQPSTLADVVGTRLPYRGPMHDDASRGFLEAVLGACPPEILLVPVTVRDRVVGVLFGEHRMRHTFDDQLALAARAAGMALERILLARRP